MHTSCRTCILIVFLRRLLSVDDPLPDFGRLKNPERSTSRGTVHCTTRFFFAITVAHLSPFTLIFALFFGLNDQLNLNLTAKKGVCQRDEESRGPAGSFELTGLLELEMRIEF